MRSMVDRRTFLIGIGALTASPRHLFAQEGPKLVILPKGITSPVQFTGFKNPHKDVSLEGWLLCNGATVSRTVYKELFRVIETRFGAGDGVSTFSLPNSPVEYHSARLVKGAAICPSDRLGLPAGVIMEFNADSNI